MKKLVSLWLAFVATMTLVVPSFAAEPVEDVVYISFEEYSAAIEAEYAKYGIEGGVYEPEGEFICTSEDLETSLAIIREYIESKGVADVPVEEKAENNGFLNPPIMPAAMPVTYTMTTSYYYCDLSVPLLPRECIIETTADITANVQNSTIMRVSTPSLEVVGGTGIADWIEYVSHSTTIDLAKKSVSMNITCKIKYELVVGAATSWNKQTISYHTTFKDIAL